MRIPLIAPREKLAYYHALSLALPQDMTAVDAWTLAMQNPVPGMRAAMWLRDRVSVLFGVAPINGFSGTPPQNVKPGDMLDFFLVVEVAPRLLVLTVRDSHLDVMTTISTYDRCLTITSSVLTHNWFGRAYMLPVGIAHKAIVWWFLRKIKAGLRET